MLDKGHQHINQICRRLADQGLIVRDTTIGGIVNRFEDARRQVRVATAVAIRAASEWAWEGNVQSRVATHLAATGWSIIRVADTAQRERGVDIIAERDGQRLLVEVKGWPSSTYARGERRRTAQADPAGSAGHPLVRRGPDLPDPAWRGARVRLALALPDMPRYRTLLGEAGWALERLDITVYLVTAEGAVEIWEREN